MTGDEKPPLGVLAHFGIKGMKWGVRRTETQLSEERRVLKRGTEFQNVSAGRAVNVGERRIFTSHTEKDNLAYRSTYAKNLKYMSDNADTYTNKLTATRDLKVASEKDAFEAFRKMYEADKPGMIRAVAESHEALTRTMFGMSDKVDQKLVDDNVKRYAKKGDKWMHDKGYDLFLTAAGTDLVSRNVADRYYTSLVKQGFDAIVDQTDKKAKLGDDPIVVLKPKGNVKLKQTLPLTDDDIKLASKLYKEKKKSDKTQAKSNR